MGNFNDQHAASIGYVNDAVVNAFEKIDIESQLTGYSSAGCITYCELPSTAQNNIDALVVIGGDGSYRGANSLSKHGINCRCR